MESIEDCQSMSLKEEKAFTNIDYDPHREQELLGGLQDELQTPKPGIIRYANLNWLPHTTAGKGATVHSKIAVIPWDRLEDFVEGQQQHPEYATTFNRHFKKSNPPESLAKPCTTSPTQIIKFHCCFGPQDHSHMVPRNIQALLDSTIQNRAISSMNTKGKRKGKKVVSEYDVFPKTKSTQAKKKRIGKKQTGKSIKRGC